MQGSGLIIFSRADSRVPCCMYKLNQSLRVGIGASGAEGLGDIGHLLGSWPDHLDATAFVVLHRPSDKESNLPAVLRRQSRIPVEVATTGKRLQPRTCYVGEPDKILSLAAPDGFVMLDGSNNQYRNRTIDVLFESLAITAGNRAVGIVLSGSLDDGSRGLAAIHAAGGLTMVLDPGAKPRGMQQNAIDYDGPISFIGSAIDIAHVLSGIYFGRQRRN